MKRKTVIILLISCLLLFAIGIGIEDIYCVYFHAGSAFKMFEVGAIGGVLIIDPAEESNFDAKALVDWADENRAALLVVGDSPGLAVCDGSGKVKALLEQAGADKSAPPLNDGVSGVYITDDAAYGSAYVKNGVFLPDTLALPVLGYYDASRLPQDLRRPFLYPLSAMNGKGMFYLTDAKNGTETLLPLLQKLHPDSEITEHSGELGMLQFLSLLLHDPVVTRSRTTTFVTVIALSLSFLFSGCMLFREYRCELAIRHLFGMSLGRMRLSFALIFGAAIAVSLLLFFGSMQMMGFSDLALSEKRLLVGVLFLVGAAETGIVNAIGFIGIKQAMGGGMRYENDRSGIS